MTALAKKHSIATGGMLFTERREVEHLTTYLKKEGVEFKDPSTGEVLSILEELETPGTEYLNITLHDDEGWKLDVYENGFVEFYDDQYDKRVVGKLVTHERVIQMWRMMQEGKRDQIKKLLKRKPEPNF
ncbi:MAG: hypothetical protein H8E27_10500 [Verrucomicrobia subdivision 3 bacterium]|nr:hypothetical protein [Limisphaerales bacterium]